MSEFADLHERLKKPRPRALEKKARATKKQQTEDAENAKVKKRSTGRCEMRELGMDILRTSGIGKTTVQRRCVRRASQIHHFLGGSGRRGVGESAKAENKLHVCDRCHDEITRHILQPYWTQVEDRAGTSYFVRLT